MKVLRMSDLALAGKRVLIREDLNVPVKDGVVSSDARIRAALPTLRSAMQQGARVIVLSHLGRPQEGKFESEFSLAPVAAELTELLGKQVPLRKDWLSGVECAPGSVVLCENVRFNKGEKNDNEALARQMAALCDVFVMDAFGTAHRAEASTHGVAKFAPQACAGPLLVAELKALERALAKPARPLIAIVAGSKVSTKLQVLEALLEKVDKLIVGGGIANTFLRPPGSTSANRCARRTCWTWRASCWSARAARGAEIPLPVDVVVAREFAGHGARRRAAGGPGGRRRADPGHRPGYRRAVQRHPAGRPVPSSGTVRSACLNSISSAKAPRRLPMPSPAASRSRSPGGGDTLAAIEKYGVEDSISYISTAAAHFWSLSKARCCLRWPCSNSGPRADGHAAQNQDRRDPGTGHRQPRGHGGHGESRARCGAHQFLARHA